MGAGDPRRNAVGRVDLRYANLLKAFKNNDPAPNRVKPIPIQVLHHAQQCINQVPDYIDQAIMELIWIAFFFLLRPGEYAKSRDNEPLRLRDVTLMRRAVRLDTYNATEAELVTATHAALTFDDQKNRERNEVIGHGLSGHPWACPVRALVRRVIYLRRNGAGPDTELCAYFHGNRKFFVTNDLISKLLKVSVAALPHLNYNVSDVSARSLRSGGAMALLCAQVDVDIIKLVGRWKSDAIFRYLHAQALPLVANLAPQMVKYGAYSLLPNSHLPPAAAAILTQEERHRALHPPLWLQPTNTTTPVAAI